MGTRGETTRARLLEVDTRLFGERGFEAVSTREIAAAAGTTLPSIPHHFGSKDGLYRAILAEFAARIEATLLPASEAATAMLGRGNAQRADLLQALDDLLAAHTRSMLSASSAWAMLIVRERMRPATSFDAIDRLIEERLHRPIAGLVGAIRGLAPDCDAVRLQALFLVGRPLVFRISPAPTLRFLGREQFDAATIEAIVAAMTTETRHLLGGD